MTDADRYFIPAQPIEVSQAIKRSRFIAHIAHCHNAVEAFKIIDQEKQRHADARHHCWAFIACSPVSSAAIRFSDDGEPSGTAGKPILNILQHSGYGEIVCVVSRYFGGIKLGAGGLVRAYSSSAQAALEQLTVSQKIPLTRITIQFPYPYEASMRHYLETLRTTIDNVSYSEQVTLRLAIENDQLDTTMQQINNLCKGDISVLDTAMDLTASHSSPTT